MPVLMHFSTFLKFLTLDTGDKIRELERYSTPGGFDFYRPSRDGVLQFASHGCSKENTIQAIKRTSTQRSEGHNLEIFEKVVPWLDRQKICERVPPHRSIWSSPSKAFSIHIEPEIGFVSKDKRRIVAVYPRKEPRLNRDKAGAGILLLQKAYNGGGDEEFGVLDAFGCKAFWSPTNVSSALLDREIDTIESELKRILV